MTTMTDSKLIIEVESQQHATDVEADRTNNPNPMSALKRPLSAYNIYFQLERNRLLDGEPERAFTLNDAIQTCDEQRLTRSLPKVKRSHRKTYGKGSFQQMARGIADSWKALDANQRQLFEGCAALEKKKYLQEKKVLNKAIAAQTCQAEVMATVSPVAERKIALAPELLASTCSIHHVQDEELVSEETSPTPCITVDDDLMTDDLEGVNYKQDVEADEHDVIYRTYQNLMHNLMIIKERQALLHMKEKSLKLMVQEHRILQQMRNGRRRNSIANSLRATKVYHQMKSLKPMFYDSPIMNIEGGLFDNLTTDCFGHGSINPYMNDFSDHSYGGMDDADHTVDDLADDFFSGEVNPFLSRPPMMNNGEIFNKLLMKGYGNNHINFSMKDCIDDSLASVYDMADDIFNIADNKLSNEESFSKLPMNSDGNAFIDFDINDCLDRSFDGADDADDYVQDSSDEACKIAGNNILSSLVHQWKET